MKIEILSPNKKIYKGEADALVLPAKEGQMQILNNHAFLFTLLTQGEIVITKNYNFQSEKISISSGIAEVKDNSIIVLIKEK